MNMKRFPDRSLDVCGVLTVTPALFDKAVSTETDSNSASYDEASFHEVDAFVQRQLLCSHRHRG